MSNRHDHRDPRSGRFHRVDVTSTPLAASGKFETQRELEIAIQGADPADLAYKVVGRDESNAGPRYAAPPLADNLAVGGSPLRARNPRLVPGDEHAETIYGTHGQGQIGRVAASRGPRDRIDGTDVEADPTRRLTGAE